MNCASTPLICAVTIGRKPFIVTGSSAILPILHSAAEAVSGAVSRPTTTRTAAIRAPMPVPLGIKSRRAALRGTIECFAESANTLELANRKAADDFRPGAGHRRGGLVDA